MIPTIFIDMDGVLADLHTGIVEFSGDSTITNQRSKLFKTWLPAYVNANGFEDQAVMQNADLLVELLLKLNKKKEVHLAILTSHGEFYEPFSEVIRQKKAWLEKNFPKLNKIPFCGTSSGADKSILANPNALLIDDHSKNIDRFIEAGGHGIVYDATNFDDHILDILNFVGQNRLTFNSQPDSMAKVTA